MLTPVVVDYFISCPIEQVSCGDTHIMVLTQAGDVYSWGSGEYGMYHVAYDLFNVLYIEIKISI